MCYYELYEFIYELHTLSRIKYCYAIAYGTIAYIWLTNYVIRERERGYAYDL